MKSEQFVKYFFEAVKNSISHSEKFSREHASRRENFAKTCRYSLEEILRNSKITEITTENYRTFSKIYFEKLRELVANEKVRHAQKVHWINQAAADIASEALNQVFQEKIQQAAGAGIAKPVAQPVPAARAALAPAKAAAPMLPAFSAALKPKSTPKSSWADTTPFQKDDFECADLSEKERSEVFEFASNCCAYPRLAVYMANAHGFNPRYSAIAINMIEAENRAATQITPNQILALPKDAEKAKELALRAGF